MSDIYHTLARGCPRRPSGNDVDGLRDYRIEQLETTVGSIEKRLEAIEVELPTLRLVRNWIIGGAVGVLSLVGLAVMALVLR